jgi:ferrochelatase
MRYSRPGADEAVASLLGRGAERILGMPLYPQFSRSTTGSSLRALRESVERLCPWIDYGEIHSWHDDPGFHAVLAQRIEASRGRLHDEEDAGLLFVAHSLPLRLVERGDPYVDQVRATVDGVLDAMSRSIGKPLPWFLAYQSRVGPVKWVGPAVEEALESMVAGGIRRIIVAPVSFVSDHLETLYDIDLCYRRHALELGVQQFERIESLNAAEDFMGTLANCIIREEGKERSEEGGD